MSSIPCNNCRRSKKKCNREKPCSRCKLQSVECIYNEVNLYKRGGTAKVAKLLDRAQNLQRLLEKALKNDIKHHCLDINKIINYWNNFKLEMTDYKDLNLPLAVAWFQIEDSLPVIVSKSSNLVKSPSNYQDAVTLLNIYITYLHPVYPFISPKKLYLLLQLSKFDNPLLTSTLCRAQVFWFAINNYSIPNLEELELYRVSISSIIKNEATISLDMVQAYINLILLELHQRQPVAASKHLTIAVYKSHQLDLHNIVPSPLNPDTEEKGCAWSFLCYIDFLCVLFLRQSPLIRVDPNLNMNSYSKSTLKYDKDKIFQSVSYEIMSQYEACAKLSWDFPKIKREFKPQRTSELTVLHLIEMLTRAQTFVNLNVDQDQLKLVNSEASSAQLGSLSIFVKCEMLIIDLCEVLASYYFDQPEISAKYRKSQRECSINLIECLYPQLTQFRSNLKSLEFFDFIDPIFPQGAFHACKILLEDNISIPDNYFGLCYKLCVNSTKLFKCNWLMMKYFERFKEHPYLIHLNSELEAEHTYLTPNHSSSSSYSYLLTSSSI